MNNFLHSSIKRYKVSFLPVFLLSLATLVAIWFLSSNLQPLGVSGLYLFAVLCMIGFVFLIGLFYKNYLPHSRMYVIKITRKIKYPIAIGVAAITLLGLIARFYIYFKFSYEPVSDPVTFFDAARRIAEGYGLKGDSYATFFPYLAAYNSLLGLSMKLINNPWLAIITLNTVLDFCGAVMAFLVVKRIKKAKSILPFIAFGIWFLSPFNILFSTISLPIITVNFFIITSLFLIILLIEQISARNFFRSLLLASATGLVIGAGNTFRPVFAIVLLAIFLVFCYIFLISQHRKNLLVLLTSAFTLLVVIFFCIQSLSLIFISSKTGLKAPSNSSGWSIYVGANRDSDGKWNRADEFRMKQMCSDEQDFDLCHHKLREAGIQRYASYGIVGTIKLFIQKLYIFSSKQNNVYNANLSITNYEDSRYGKTMASYINVFVVTLFSLSALFLYKSARSSALQYKTDPVFLLIALIILGFFASAMLVETSERYAQIMYPLFTLTAVLSFSFINIKHKKIGSSIQSGSIR